MVGKINGLPADDIKERLRDVYAKIAVIGDHDSILGFKAVGVTAFPVTEPEQTKAVLKSLVGTKRIKWCLSPNRRRQQPKKQWMTCENE